jgi:hypothetical protein
VITTGSGAARPVGAARAAHAVGRVRDGGHGEDPEDDQDAAKRAHVRRISCGSVAIKRIYDMRMNDGSRHFAGLPETYCVARPQWEDIRDHVPQLEGAVLTGYATDQVTEAWIDFTFCGHAFSMNNQNGEWWFFVTDPACAAEILDAVLVHFEALLGISA